MTEPKWDIDKAVEDITRVAEAAEKILTTDYGDGRRGYCLVVALEILLKYGYRNTVCDRIGQLIKIGGQEKYWVYKFDTRFLDNDEGLAIRGVGWKMPGAAAPT